MPPLQAIRWARHPTSLTLLDQRLLPGTMEYIDIPGADAAHAAIKDMAVRGAPALAIAAALGLAVELANGPGFPDAAAAAAAVRSRAAFLDSARPTAVNLGEAMRRLSSVAAAAAAAAPPGQPGGDAVVEAVIDAAEGMLADDVTSNHALAAFGADALVAAAVGRGLARAGAPLRVLTHCNTGALATAAHGTALGVIRTLAARGALDRAFCTETRPYNQGARLTAFELAAEGLPATLLVDSAAAGLLIWGGTGPADPPETAPENLTGAAWAGRPHAVVVGADRVASNGDTANKVGTLALAVAASAAGVPFFVAAPTTTLDPDLASGAAIPIEQRPADEITHSPLGDPRPRVAAAGVAVWNPSFDVTPSALITGGIITEVGLVKRVVGGDGAVSFDVAAAVEAGVARRAGVGRAAAVGGEAATGASADAAATPGADPGAPTPFNPASVRAYLAARPALAERLGGAPADWTVEELSDGNLNFVFLVRGPGAGGAASSSSDGGALVLKQALPYIRIDKGWPLPASRAGVEAAALEEHGRLAPGAVPTLYSYDPASSVLAMEWVRPPAAVVRGLLNGGGIVPGLAGDVARYLARTAFGTSLFALPSPAWRELAARFPNAPLCGLTEKVVFDDPFHDAPANADHGPAAAACPALASALAALKSDAAARAAGAAAKARFCEQRQALLHGDLHTGSVMGVAVGATSDWEALEAAAEAASGGGGSGPGGARRAAAVIIDPEFACAGPVAWDAGKFAANLLIAFLAADGRRGSSTSPGGGEDAAVSHQQAWLAASIPAFWATFTTSFAELWDGAAAAGTGGALAPAPLVGADALDGAQALALHQQAFFADTLDGALRFGGAVLLRRVVGIAQVSDFRGLPDPAGRGRAMAAALRVGRDMLVGGRAAFPGGWRDVVAAAEGALAAGRKEEAVAVA